METHKIKLGFTDKVFSSGVHICQIYETDEERQNVLVDFVVSGMQNGEKTACFTEKEDAGSMKDILNSKGLSIEEQEANGSFSIRKTSEVYFEGGSFSPERQLEMIRNFYSESKKEKKSGARIIGEMPAEIESVDGGARLLEYESNVSILLRDHPIATVCQYDARAFGGTMIIDILKVHEYMIIKGKVVNNPFFVHPEDFLRESKTRNS